MSASKVNRNAGAPTRSQVKALSQNTKASNDQMYMINNYDESVGNNFPIRPFESDPMDTRVNIINELTYGGAINQARPMPYTEAEIAYFERKAEQERFAAFDSWVSTRFDLTDIAQVSMLKSIYPQYFERRDALIDEQADLAKDVAKMRNRGFSSLSDLMTEWQIETGALTLPAGPLWNPNQWLTNQMADPSTVAKIGDSNNSMAQYTRNVYQHGLFNPLKPLAVLQGAFAPNPNNPADIRGLPGTNWTGPVNANVPSNNSWFKQYALPGGPGSDRTYAAGTRERNTLIGQNADPYRANRAPADQNLLYTPNFLNANDARRAEVANAGRNPAPRSWYNQAPAPVVPAPQGNPNPIANN